MDFAVSDIATFCLLVGLELVLGIDNILLISIVTSRLPASQQKRARHLALGLAFGFRVLLVMGAAAIVRLSDPIFWNLSWKDMILIAGGGFLLFKAVKEIHHVVEAPRLSEQSGSATPTLSFGSAIVQLLLLDLVFSIDSVITAVGLTSHLLIIISSVLVSFGIVLLAASRVATFIESHPALKILALSFLITIGVTLFIEGLGFHVPKTYIYLPMGFALGVELLQMRFSHNLKKPS